MHRGIILSISLGFPAHQCAAQIFITRGLYGTLSSLPSRTPHISARVLQNKQLLYHTTHRRFGFHHIWLQCLTPVLSVSAYFNKFTVLASYVLCLRCKFCLSMSFPLFFPRTQTGYEHVFHFLACLSSMVAGTPEHQCLLFHFSCCSCRDTVAHQRVVEVFLNNGIIIDKGFFISINIVNIEEK